MWLYIPAPETSPPYPSAPEAAPSISPLTLRFLDFVQSYTWRGKPSPLHIWQRRLKRVFWLRRLFGRMPEQSQADAFAASWISCLAASRASRTASPASAAAPPTSATYGPPPGASSSSPALGPCSSKTSAACSPDPPATEFSETYAAWVSRLREDFLRRQKSAAPTSAKGSSSSRSAAQDPPSLELWPTPIERDYRSIHAGAETHDKNSRPLSEAAGLWATPTVADTEGGRKTRSGPRKGELLLPGQARELTRRLDPEPASNGAPSSPPGLTLNPLFVEWLMDWPTGWTLLADGPLTPSACESTGCASSAMVFYRWRRRLRSELSRLALPPTRPAQLDLFG